MVDKAVVESLVARFWAKPFAVVIEAAKRSRLDALEGCWILMEEGSLRFLGELQNHTVAVLGDLDLNASVHCAKQRLSESISYLIVAPNKHIDENAFESCVSLVAAAMPSAGLRVDNSAFSDTNIKILYLYGTDAQVGELFETGISSQNKPLHEAKIYLYSEAEPTGETAYDGFWYLDENERTRIWK